MKPIHLASLILIFTVFLSCTTDESTKNTDETPIETTIYFPPLNSDEWETETISEVGWNENELLPLLDFLEEKNTKGFIILHKGKIVVESYMNGHESTSPWYWASAGKTLTTTVTGIAQDEGLLTITDLVSDYIGSGWTSIPLEKENLITCKTLLTMTSGLDDSLGDGISPEDLQYLADAGDRWAYHGVFLKLQDVIASASNDTWTNYFNTRLKDKIGMTGLWIPFGETNVYWSTTRSMARFGLLAHANGKWNDMQIVSENFMNDAVSTSQNINKAYGYLWWLNGKSSYRLPQSQFEFSGMLIPNAPFDMYCALGKDDQKIYIVPSKDLVVIRMGEAADNSNFALSTFDYDLWEHLNLFLN